MVRYPHYINRSSSLKFETFNKKFLNINYMANVQYIALSVFNPVFCSRTATVKSQSFLFFFFKKKTKQQTNQNQTSLSCPSVSWVWMIWIWNTTVSVAPVTTAFTVAVLIQIHAIRGENGVYYKLLLGHLVVSDGYHLKRSLPDF